MNVFQKLKKTRPTIQPLKAFSNYPEKLMLLDTFTSNSTSPLPPPMLNSNSKESANTKKADIPYLSEKTENGSAKNAYEQYEVRGPEGQVCESKEVLDAILTKYTHISTNNFKGGASGKIKAEYMICNCVYDYLTDEPHMACGLDSGCINRELSIECPDDGCPCDPFCQNRKFSLRQYAPIQVFDTQNKGFGLRTKMALQKGTFVIEYCGDIIPTTIFKKRIIEYAKSGAQHFYFMSLKGNEYIDASKKGNISRFMNHSCNPNCQLQKWVVGSQMRIGIFTIRDVPEGSELTFDYKFERYGNEAQPCYCGESNCLGFIGKEQSESSSSMTIESNEELSEEEEDDDQSPEHLRSQNSQAKALQSLGQVKGIVKYLMMFSGNPTKVLRAINKLLKTESSSLQRKFIHFRGLYLLERCLIEHLNSKSIVKHNILLALQMLPISTKNAIVKLELTVQQMTSAETFGFATAELAKKILESWASLEMVYKIPKRVKGVDFSEQEVSGSTANASVNEMKRTRSNDESDDRGSKFRRSVSQTPPDGFSSNIQLPEVSYGVIKQIEEKRLDFTWNQIITTSALNKETSASESVSKSTPKSVEALTATSIEEMVEAAQEASRQRQEALKLKELEELEKQKRISHAKKKLMKERKEKQRELSQALGRKLVENALLVKGPSSTVSTPKERKDPPKASKLGDNAVPEEAAIKKMLSNAIIKVMSRYKDQMNGDLFKERAKVITKGLLEKELRKHHDEKRTVPTELSEASLKAVKKYVKEYLARHDVKIE